MHKVLVDIKEQLEAVVDELRSNTDRELFDNAHGKGSFSLLTCAELSEEAQAIVDLIEAQGGDELGVYQARLEDYVRRLKDLQQHTVDQLWGNAAQAIPAYLLTLQGLRKALDPVLPRDGPVTAARTLRTLIKQLRDMASRLNGLAPRVVAVDKQVQSLKGRCDNADRLLEEFESLSETRQNIINLVNDAKRQQGEVEQISKRAAGFDEQLSNVSKEAQAVLERCETAYSAATTVGLAAAFSERSKELSTSMWVWVAGLVTALALGGYFGAAQLHALLVLFKLPDVATPLLFVHLLLAVLSVGGPVWAAWLATKQIGQRFRLAEDYAFKAAVSRAYEGFRREAARFDKDMEAKLLTSALARFDELPIRLVDTDSHGSPWHELAESQVVKQAIQTVPGFFEEMKDSANKALAQRQSH